MPHANTTKKRRKRKAALAPAGSGREQNSCFSRAQQQHRQEPTLHQGDILGMAEAPEADRHGDGAGAGGDDDADPEGELQHQIRNGTLFEIGLLGVIDGFDHYGFEEPFQTSSDAAAVAAAADTLPGTAFAEEEDEDGEEDCGAEFEGSGLDKSDNDEEAVGLCEGDDAEGAADEDGGGGGGFDANSENSDDASADKAAESGDGKADDEKHGGIKKEMVVSKLSVDVIDPFTPRIILGCLPRPSGYNVAALDGLVLWGRGSHGRRFVN